MNEQEYENMIRDRILAGQSSESSTKQMQNQLILEERERGMIHEQLDLTEEIQRIEHLLRGHVQREENGRLIWVESEDPDMIILTEYGIHLILNTISWYINKNTLLSNYDNETIIRKMRDFASALNKTIFMEYEKVFKRPTFQECKDVLMQRLKKKVELRTFALELVGEIPDQKKIEEEFLRQLETRVEKEMDKIRESIMKSKLTRYLLLIREVQDAVHSTYNRAYQGMERKTLREHVNVSEVRGTVPTQQKGGLLSWIKGS